jgi:hypothetical protein
MWARQQRMTDQQIAAHFGVTETLAIYRLRMTGVDAQVRASRGRRR